MKRWTVFGGSVVVLVCCMTASGQTQPALGPNHPDVLARENARLMALKLARSQVEESRDQLDRRAEVEMIQSKIRDESGLLEATPEGLRQLAERLQQQEEAMGVEEAGAHGRQEALESAIARYSDQMKKRAEADDVSMELTKVLKARQNQLARVQEMRKMGTIAQSEIDTAEVAVATAQAELAASRQRATGAAGETLEAWNRELLNLSIASRERAAKLDFVRSRLKTLAPALRDVRELERRIPDLKRAERWLDSAMEQLRAEEALQRRHE